MLFRLKSLVVLGLTFSISAQGQTSEQIGWEFFSERAVQHPELYPYHRYGFWEFLEQVKAQLEVEYAQAEQKLENTEHVLELPSFYLKKSGHGYQEMVAWEISHLLHLDKYIPFASIVTLSGEPLLLKRKSEIEKNKNALDLSPLAQKAELQEYWLANITAYILGMGGLSETHIGYARNTLHPLYSEVENSFAESNDFKMRAGSGDLKYDLQMFFSSRLLSGRLFYQKLDEQAVEHLQRFQEMLRKKFLPKLSAHLEGEEFLNEAQKMALKDRVQRILNAPFQAGMSFNEYLRCLFPSLPPTYSQHFHKISKILNRGTQGVGGALVWLASQKQQEPTRLDQIERINEVLDALYADYRAQMLK